MIYLFCNQNYGRSFIEAAIEFQKSEGIKLRLVFSQKRKLPVSKLKKAFVLVLWHLKKTKRELKLKKLYGLPVHVVRDVNSRWFYRKIDPEDHGIIAGFNQIFKDVVINRFKTFINFHPSILPLYRGPVPSYWCIQNREEVTGFTMHKVNAAIDCGEILFQDTVIIEKTDKEMTLDQKISKKAAATFKCYLDKLVRGERWRVHKLNAFDVYRVHVDYASFPSKK